MSLIESGPVSWSETIVPAVEDDPPESNRALTIMSFVLRQGLLGAAMISREHPQLLRLLWPKTEMLGLPTVEDCILYNVHYTMPITATRAIVIIQNNPDVLITPGRGKGSLQFVVKSILGHCERPQRLHLMGLSTEYKGSLFQSLFSVEAEELAEGDLSISAAAAIISLIRKGSINVELPSTFEWFKLSSAMSVGMDTLLALQIVEDETHPNTQFTNQPSGLSLQGIMNRCKSAGGRLQFKTWVMQPLTSKEGIDKRLFKVQWVLENIAHKGFLPALQSILRGIPRIELIWDRVMAQRDHTAFKDLVTFCKSTIELEQLLSTSNCPFATTTPTDHPRHKHRNELKFILESIVTLVRSVVDFMQSEAQGRIVVKGKVNPDLDKIRQQYYGLPDFLSKVVQKIAEGVSNPKIKKINVVYLPQLGFLITVPLPEGETGAESLHEDGFELQFTTTKIAYFKDQLTKGLDEEIGDVYADMIDLEVEITRALIEQLDPFQSLMMEHGRWVSEIDCLQSLVDFAIENNLTKPILTDGLDLEIQGGRHLLQEKVSDHVVPNDCILQESERLMILTGPNSSGKSIFVKQVALIVYMAQMGSFVPADYARIGIVDRIYTRIRTRDLVSSMSSAFQTDALQIKKALQGMTRKSLLIMDEFGKGTRAEEGIAIFVAVIKELVDRGLDSPRAIAITHFHEIYQMGLLGPEQPIKWCTMDFIKRPDRGDELVFLYKVVAGKAQDSFAIDCGQRAGLPEKVLERARNLLELYGARVTPMCLRYAQIDSEMVRKATELIQATLHSDANVEELKKVALKFLNQTLKPQ